MYRGVGSLAFQTVSGRRSDESLVAANLSLVVFGPNRAGLVPKIGAAGFSLRTVLKSLNDRAQLPNLFLLLAKDLGELFAADLVHFVVQLHDLEFRLQVDLVVVCDGQPVLSGLAVLRHHDDRRLDCREHGQDEVQEHKGIRIEDVFTRQRYGIHDNPDRKNHAE